MTKFFFIIAMAVWRSNSDHLFSTLWPYAYQFLIKSDVIFVEFVFKGFD